jgi:hypothetical protein
VFPRVPDDVIPDQMTITVSETFLIVTKLKKKAKVKQAGSGSGARRAAYCVCVRPLACWVCGFESCLGHGCLSSVNVVFRQVKLYASGRPLVQRSPTDCGVSEYNQMKQ